MKVQKITVSNLKAVKNLTADFNGCTAILTGGNNKGKSSFLKSLPERFQGVKGAVLSHDANTGFAEWTLTNGEKFFWSFDAMGEKLVFVSEKNISKNVTKEISSAYFPKSFDIDKFLREGPLEQSKMFQSVTGLDFTEADKAYKNAFEDRTFANRALNEAKAKLIQLDPEAPEKEVDVIPLEQELAGVDAHNRAIKGVEDGIKEREDRNAERDTEIKELEAKIIKLKGEKTAAEEQIKAAKLWLLKPEKQKITPEKKAEIELKLKNAREANEKFKNNADAKRLQEDFEAKEKAALEIDAEVKKIQADREEMIRLATLPAGFGFDEKGGITYNGFAFNKETLSSSAMVIAALKLARTKLGKVETLFFDASYLDRNSLLEVEQWAESEGVQLLIERPDFEGGEITYEIIQPAENGN